MSDSQSSFIHKAGVVEQAGQLQTVAKSVRAELDSLDAKVEKLKSQWSGAAQAAYGDAHKKWVTKTDEMNVLLDRIGAKAIELSGQYGQQDNKSAGRFTQS